MTQKETEIPVVVIGAGFGGICMAVRLKQAGIPFVVLEKGDAVGGVWRDNVYPGAACDIPSHLYSFSFEPYAEWSRRFGTQPEIRGYIEHCAHRYGILDHVRLNTEVESTRFDESTGRWTLRLANEETLHARFVVAATGQLGRPALPNIPGLDDFPGPVFHSARWNHDVELEGKRVAVIGTGASAIQFVPKIVPQVSRLHLFQRSAQYILPKPDREYPALVRYLFGRFPGLLAASRLRKYAQHEARALTFTRGVGAGVAGWIARRHLRKQVKDPTLRRLMTPDYPFGCKRVLISNDWYPAIANPKVEVIADHVESIDGDRIVTADGTERSVDAIILGTGFQANDFLAPIDVVGRAGRRLREEWKDGAEAYLGMTVAGFPNLYVLYGPNTNLGHNSIIYMLERQVEYALAGIRHIGIHGRSFADVHPNIQDQFNHEIQAELATTVWEAGCTSWYRTESGKNTNNWPGSTFGYRKRTRYFDAGHYELVTPTD